MIYTGGNPETVKIKYYSNSNHCGHAQGNGDRFRGCYIGLKGLAYTATRAFLPSWKVLIVWWIWYRLASCTPRNSVEPYSL